MAHAQARLSDLPTITHELLDCVCAELDALTESPTDLDHPGCPCIAAVYPAQPAWCCQDCSARSPAGGQLAVWVDRTFAYSDTFPVPARTVDASCKGGIGVAADIRVLVLRCWPQPGKDGRQPKPEVFERTAEIVQWDLIALWRAVLCCYDREPFLPGVFRTVGPRDGCVGTEAVVTVDLGTRR